MNTVTLVQIFDEDVCISQCYTLGKGMHLIIHSPAMYVRQGSLTLVWQPVLEKENSEFKPSKLCLIIDFVSHTALDGSVG